MNNLNKDLISVIIPCFNSGSTIQKTIDSLRNQSWKNLEIIIINDGSDDDFTIRKLSSFKKDIKVITQINLGLPAARNKGFSLAKGKYIFPLDADDWLEPEALELMYKELISDKNISFVYSDDILEGKLKGIRKNKYNYFEQLFFNRVPYAILIPKEIWELSGGYDENFNEGYEDWEFNIRLGSIGFLGKRVKYPVFHYSVSNNGMLISKSNKKHFSIFKKIINKNKKIYKLKSLFKTWKEWKNKSSKYPFSIYFFIFISIKFVPDELLSRLFLLLRDLKCFLKANKIN